MNQNKLTHTSLQLKRKNKKSRGQAMLEFALALPILLMIIFGIIDFALVFQAWLQIENMVRQTTRYAITGQYDEKYCTAEYITNTDGSDEYCDSLEEQDAARLLSVQAVADSQRIILFNDDVGIGEDDIGYIHVTICSDRDVNENEDSSDDYVYIEPQMGTTSYGDCDDSGTTRRDAGGPGDQVYIAVDFNHPFITPFLNKAWPMIHLASYREGRVETFRVSKVTIGPDAPEIPDTLTPTITNTPSPTITPSPTATINPFCAGIDWNTDWVLKDKALKIKVENTSGSAVYVDQAVFNWNNYDAYAPEQSVVELKFDKTKIYQGSDPDSLTDSGSGHNVKLDNGNNKDFKATFVDDVGDDWDAVLFGPSDFGVALSFTNGCTLHKLVTTIIDSPDSTPTPSGPTIDTGSSGEIYYIGDEDPSVYLKVTWETSDDGSVTIKAEFSKNFNDNTYGSGAQTDWTGKKGKCKNNNGSGQCDDLDNKLKDGNLKYFCTAAVVGCDPGTDEWAFYPQGDLTCTDYDFDGFCDEDYSEFKDKDGDGQPDYHTFRDLFHSDHLIFDMIGVNADGSTSTFFKAKMDLLAVDPSTPSGWGTGGVVGTGDFSDSSIYTGDASMVTSTKTSMDYNLNDLGCTDNIVDNGDGTWSGNSPSIDENYNQTGENACAGWDFGVWFEITIEESAIPPGGFYFPQIDSIHASPSKKQLNTLGVTPGASPTPTSPPTFTPTITFTPLPTLTPVPTFTPGGPTATKTAGPETATPTLPYFDN